MTAPSETPLTDISERLASASLRNAGFFNVGFCRVLDMQVLETALAESRAECERLRTQSDSLNTLNLGQIKIIAKLQSDLREAETREREAYERAAKDVAAKQAKIDALMLEYCPNEMTENQIATWKDAQVVVPQETEDAINRALSGERREG